MQRRRRSMVLEAERRAAKAAKPAEESKPAEAAAEAKEESAE